MTSRTESFPSEYTAAPRYPWNRVAFTFALTLGAIVLFGAAFAIGYARMNEGRVLPGVDVGGVDLAGLSRSAAGVKLRSSLPSLSTGDLTVDVAGETETIPYSSFDRDYDMQVMLDQAFGLGQGSNFIDQLREQIAILINGVSVQPTMTWNNDVLSTRVAALAAAAQVSPVDAAISRVDGRYVVTPSQDGLSVDLQQAVTMAMAAVNNLSPVSTQITVEGTPVAPTVTTEQAQAAADQAEAVVGNGLSLSGENLTTNIDPDVLRGWVYLNEVSLGDWQLSIAPEPISQYLAAYAATSDIPPTNANFGFTGGNVSVIPSALGRALDVDATTANVLAALQQRADGQDTSQATLALAVTEPEFTTEQAQALASRVTMIGTWTTHYTPQQSNGQGVNIQIPTRTIDGYIVQPGERFDFLNAIGPITSPPYVEGGVLIHGQIREDGAIGGGMCSCSTTLFNAALRAGLQIDARGNHSIYISRYPVGLDATVWMSGGSRRTMAFTNDTGYPVLIKGINERTKVTFELYGINDGRTVEIQDPRVEDVVKGGAWYEFTDDLAPGVKRKEQDAYDAFNAWVTRIVRDAQGNVLHEDTFFSHYKKLDAITLVGRYPGDPPDGTLVRPEDYHPGGTPPPPPTDGSLVADFSKAAVDGDTYAFTDASIGSVVARSWDFGDGGSSTNRNPTHDYAAEGTYTVTLTVTDSLGQTSSRSRNVTVSGGNPPPPPDSWNANYSAFQVAGTYKIHFVGKPANADSWSWSIGPTDRVVDYDFGAAGDYNVTLTVTKGGETKEVTKTVHVVEIV